MVARRKSLLMGAPLVILAAAGAQSAAADDATPPAPPAAPASQDATLLEEIIVTVEKQATGRPLQIVPIAVSSIDSTTMQDQHVTSIVDVGHMAPNVVLDSSGTLFGTAAFTIRGVGSRTSTASEDPAVAVTQDGMPLSLQTGLAELGTFDTEQVQILRGPQGVLQGVGAAGGAVTFTTPLPTDTFQASSSVTAGNFDTIGATATVQGPLSDNVLGKIAVYEQRVAGYYNNTTDEGTYAVAPDNPTGTEPQHSTGLVGGTQVVVVKPTFLFNLSDTAKLKVFAQFESDNDGATAAIAIDPDPAPGSIVKAITRFGYTPTPDGSYDTNIGTLGWTHITEEHLIGELDLNVGSGVWTTNAAIRNINYNSVYNNAGTPFNILLVYTQEENRQASIESRWSGALTDKLNFLSGIYLFDDNLPVQVINANNVGELGDKLVDTANVNSPLNMDNQLIQYNQKTTSAALFFNFDYDILSDLTFSAGARYQYERKIFDIQPGTALPTTATPNPGVQYCTTGTLNNCPSAWYDVSKAWNTPTPRAVLSWRATQDFMTYISYTRGWAAGNFNGSPSTLQAALNPANPETVNSYEVGFKSELFDHHFRANVALFDEKFDDIQRSATTAIDGLHVQTLVNAASATIKGAEAELDWLPFQGVKLFSTGGFTNAVYDKFTVTSLPADTYNPNEPPTELSFANLPRWTTDGGGSYTFSLPNVDGKFTFTADYSWRSMQFGDFGNTPQEIIKAYGLLNGAISHTSGPWTVSLWGRNLTNKYYDEAAAISGTFQQYPGIPRTYGLTAYLTFR